MAEPVLSSRPRPKWELAALAAICLFALALRGWHLSQPETMVFDEKFYVPVARNLTHGLPDVRMSHPPLGKLMMAAGMQIWGTVERILPGVGNAPSAALESRFGGLVLGVAMVALVFFLGRSMFGSAGGCIAAFLLAVDCLHIVMSRTAMLDIYQAFFALCGTYCVWEYVAAADAGKKWLWPACLALACSVAVKWSGLFSCVAALAAVLLLRPADSPQGRLRSCARLAAMGGATVAVVYLASFLLLVPFCDYRMLGGLLHHARAEQQAMVEYRFASGTLPLASAWWQWPTLLRPVWFYFKYRPPGEYSVALVAPTNFSAGKVCGILATGSPWVWWTFLPLLAAQLGGALRQARQRLRQPLSHESLALAFCTVFYLIQLLLWALNHGFIYYMLSEVPLMCLLLAGWTRRWLVGLRYGRILAAFYLIMTLLALVLYWPLLTYQPLPTANFVRLILIPRTWLIF